MRRAIAGDRIGRFPLAEQADLAVPKVPSIRSKLTSAWSLGRRKGEGKGKNLDLKSVFLLPPVERKVRLMREDLP
jgi:hypothetical protein